MTQMVLPLKFSPAQSSSGRGMAIGSKLKRTKAGMCQDKTPHIQTNPSMWDVGMVWEAYQNLEDHPI